MDRGAGSSMALNRALNGAQSAARSASCAGGQRPTRPCGLCGRARAKLFRAKIAREGDWLLLCPMCCGRAIEDNPDFAYGGTIAPRRRRAS